MRRTLPAFALSLAAAAACGTDGASSDPGDAISLDAAGDGSGELGTAVDDDARDDATGRDTGVDVIDDGSGVADAAATPCVTAADCAGGQLCVDGACVPFCFGDADCPPATPVCDPAANRCVGCLETGDCGEGQACEGGACVSVCTTSADCRGGEVCRGGQCVAICGSDADCGDGARCDGGTCVPVDDGCTASGDCEGGEACVAGVCVPIGGDCVDGAAECVSDRAGRVCAGGTWTPVSCPEDTLCVDGACAEFPGTCDTPGASSCQGDDVVVCGTDGTPVAVVPCGGRQTCEDGACVERACTQDDNFCVSDRVIARCDEGSNVFFEEDCHPQLACAEGACVFPGGANLCGGGEILEALPGDACGACGLWECNDGGSVSCADPGLNACEGCGEISVTLGGECGDCGAYACAEGGAACDDPGFNGCGRCDTLEGEPGAACGECGVWECTDGGWLSAPGVDCNDPGANRCGGCAELATFPGDLCPTSGEVYVCDGDDALSCARNRTDSCFTPIECNIFAAQFGISDPLGIACDGDVGCYLKGNCSPDGRPTDADPFGSACRAGTTCTVVPLIGWQTCTGCTVGDASTCRSGEECRSIFGLISYCADPLSLLPG